MSPVQGDGKHLRHGSIQSELNRLQLEVDRLKIEIGTAERISAAQERRIRSLEGALRDVTSAAACAIPALEARE